MAKTEYAYAVARIRGREMALLTDQILDQLITAASHADCIRILGQRGWAVSGDDEDMLEAERDKTWDLIRELVKDMSAFGMLLYANDYQNLKAAIKEAYGGEEVPGIYMKQGLVPVSTLKEAAKTHRFNLLAEPMRLPAQEAYLALAHSGDSQLCDTIIDEAALEAILKAGETSGNDLMREYARLTVTSANIRTVLRALRTGKSDAFLKKAVADCPGLGKRDLLMAAAGGEQEVYRVLAATEYAGGLEALKTSLSAFERWCDNLMIERIRPQLHVSFGIGPMFAYILARENEIKSVRIILAGKRNALPEDLIRERVRITYV